VYKRELKDEGGGRRTKEFSEYNEV